MISSNFPKEGALYETTRIAVIPMRYDDGRTVRRFWLCAIARPDGTIGIVQPWSQWAKIRKKYNLRIKIRDFTRQFF